MPKKLKKFRIGMRTFKTGLSVALVTVIYETLLTGGSAQIAALSSVFSQRTNFSDTMNYGRFRAVGNSIGGLVALLFVLITDLIPLNESIQSLFPALGIMMTIALCNSFNHSAAIIGACAAFLIIIFTIPEDNQYIYTIYRVFDTFMGALVAIFIEYLLPRSRLIKWQKRVKQSFSYRK